MTFLPPDKGPIINEAQKQHGVLRPGGRGGITAWGHLMISPGAWASAPFRLAAAEKVGNQAVMVSLGWPGMGEQLLESYGFVAVERLNVPFAWEFADPEQNLQGNSSFWPLHLPASTFNHAKARG